MPLRGTAQLAQYPALVLAQHVVAPDAHRSITLYYDEYEFIYIIIDHLHQEHCQLREAVDQVPLSRRATVRSTASL